MANLRKGRRKTNVHGCMYCWYVADASDGEGFWTLFITSDANWQNRIVYPLTEIELQNLVTKHPDMPLPDEYDRELECLTDFKTTEIGNDRHVVATPKLVQRLVAWYSVNVWNLAGETSPLD